MLFDDTSAATYRAYRSSIDSSMQLYGQFIPLAEPAPLQLSMHGWHGSVKTPHGDNVAAPANEIYFRVQPEMRGRGDSDGKPDANGWELQDAVDALNAAKQIFPSATADVTPHLHGGSGGGGNVLGLLGKFPDLFASAVCECGISDYALWYAHDSVGEFRDELRDKNWVGGDPQSNPEAYLSRGGRTTAGNLLTPLLMMHGCDDKRVPFEQAQVYIEALKHHGKEWLAYLQAYPGVGVPGHFSGMNDATHALRKKMIAEHHGQHLQAPTLRTSGRMVVAGYLRTAAFDVTLETVDQVALLEYDLKRSRFVIKAPSCKQAMIQTTGQQDAQRVACEVIEFKEFCKVVGVPDPREF